MRRSTPCATAAALLFLFVSVAPGQVDAEVFTRDGRTHAGTLTGMKSDGTLALQGTAGDGEIAFDSVHLIRFVPGTDPLPDRPGGTAVGILLPGGDYLTGTLVDGDADEIVLGHPLLGTLEIPIDAVRTLLPGERSIPAEFTRYPAAEEEDVVYRKREEALGEDFIRGTVDLITAKSLAFECSLGMVEFPFGKLNAVVIAGDPEGEGAPPDVAAVALLRGGTGRLSGAFAELRAGALVLRDGPAGERSIPLAAIDSIAFDRKTTTYLSDLDPESVEETPFLGEPGDFLFPFRRDRSVSDNELGCGGFRFARGLGVHSRCVLTYSLGGEYSSFHCFAGISDEVLRLRARGSILFRISVDGRSVYESPVLRGGDPIVAIPPVRLEGAKTLTLEAGFADGFDSGDRGFWGHALLVR